MMTSVDDPRAALQARSDLNEISKEMSASQRALELRKFFAPFDPHIAPEDSGGYNTHLNDDGALDSYAENVVWRLRAARSMVSLVDRGIQYFLAGAIREGDDHSIDISHDGEWFGCNAIPTPGGLCENTLDLPPWNKEEESYPCFTVKDLSNHKQYCKLPVVNGEISSYRFYAGTPITTELGVNIGSFFIFDYEPRPSGLSLEQRKYLVKAAENVMKHLQTKREAAERKRVSLMSRGIANFLEKTSRVTEKDIDSNGDIHNGIPSGKRAPGSRKEGSEGNLVVPEEESTAHPEQESSEQTLDKIKVTLDHAASILRESLELTVGGVVFLDVALGYRQEGVTDAYFDAKTDIGAEIAEQQARIQSNGDDDFAYLQTPNTPNHAVQDASRRTGMSPGQVRSFEDHSNAAKILAVATAKSATWNSSSNVLDGRTLQTFIKSYPKGNVWYVDEDGFFSSLDQANEAAEKLGKPRSSHNERSRSVSQLDIARQQAEASLLTKVFKGARQIIFVPLWDAGGDRWHSGCFVWSRSAVPVFTIESEISYLSAFTNSVMVEISRLDALTANKMKGDFIANVSHELRSPLHAILASAEFLRESDLETTQAEFVSTIQNSGSTLLDTINHVLDYSKINSFEKSGNKGGISNELYKFSNIALLCEEVINGMIAASEYQHTQFAGTSKRPGIARITDPHVQYEPHERPVEVILDIEFREWNFRIQPGALRRIIMNIFGNAQKYTASGFILVQLRVRDDIAFGRPSSKTSRQVLAVNIIDSGRGMSTEYMERKLYTPFAQEDTFATGVGLGLSIVWSIVNQLGGKIQIRSDVGKGTDVEILIPLDEDVRVGELVSDDTVAELEAARNIDAVRRIADGKSVAIWRSTHHSNHSKRNKSLAWDCLEKYCETWFGFQVLSTDDFNALSSVDLVIMEQQDKDFSGLTIPFSSSKSNLLLIRDELSWHDERKSSKFRKENGNIWTPIGPYKLARSILGLFSQTESSSKQRPKLPTAAYLDSSKQTLIAPLSMTEAVSKTEKGRTIESVPSPLAEAIPKDLARSTTQASHNASITGAIVEDKLAELAITSDKPTANSGAVQRVSNDVAGHQPSRASGKAAASTSPAPLRLLVVDDNDVNLQLLTRYLKKRKSDIIVTARDGLEALNAVKLLHTDSEGREKYDIIFMDISMPIMDGFDSTCAIRMYESKLGLGTGHSGRSFIVALTGLGSRRDRDRAAECGVDDFMTKPVSFAKVGELVGRMSREKKSKEFKPLEGHDRDV